MHNFTQIFVCVCLSGNEIAIGTENQKRENEPSKYFFYTSSIFGIVFEWELLKLLP